MITIFDRRAIVLNPFEGIKTLSVSKRSARALHNHEYQELKLLARSEEVARLVRVAYQLGRKHSAEMLGGVEL